jgi:AcrR family transcriptional regulator
MPMSTAEAVDGDKPNGPRSRKGVQTRARLVDAAKQIFEENGFLEARISDIAERAGLSHGSFYHYFDSKEQVFREVAEGVYEKLAAPMTEVVLVHGSSVPPAQRLHEAIRRHFDMYRDEARIMGVIEQVSRYDDYVRDVVEAQNRTSRDLISDSIKELQKRKMADADLDPLIAAAALGSMTNRFAEMWLAQGMEDFDLDAAAATVSRLFANALGLEAEGDSPRRRQLKAK